MKTLIQGVLLLSIVYGSFSALPTCTGTGECPPEGIWSEWSTTQNCTTSCGACSRAYYTRTCFTEPKCNCVGNNTRYTPCNTKPCVYPAQRACCLPNVPMVINGVSVCGPPPKEPASTSCCPTGGIWSEWTGYVRNDANTGFERTRKCLSMDAGCACNGNALETSSATCPCKILEAAVHPNFTINAVAVKAPAASLDPVTCIYRAELDDAQINCSSWTRGSSIPIRIMRRDTNRVVDVRVAGCDAADTGKRYVTMYCDLTSGYYRLWTNNAEVLSWTQVRLQCASDVTCPPGGLWSEWTTTDDTCATLCGSCSKVFHTRTCLTENVNCTCTGNSTRYYPCNTSVCKYPAQRACCVPYVPMLINMTSQCGPFPKDSSISSSSCCPVNGIWSEWTGFARTSTTPYQYVRTRDCLSSSAGCPCTGDSTNSQSNCPCSNTLPKGVADVIAKCSPNNQSLPNSFRAVNINECFLIADLVASNDVDHPCSPYDQYQFVPLIFLLPSDPTAPCQQDRPFDCEARKSMTGTPGVLPISFTCNYETAQWIYDYNGLAVDGFAQMEFPK